MNAELHKLLARVESGDYETLGPLADMLEEQGDRRAILAREVMRCDGKLESEILYHLRTTPLSDDSVALAFPESGFVAALSSLVGQEVRTGSSSFGECVRDIQQAITNKQLSTDVARAITLSRRMKCDRFLALFREQTPTHSCP